MSFGNDLSESQMKILKSRYSDSTLAPKYIGTPETIDDLRKMTEWYNVNSSGGCLHDNCPHCAGTGIRKDGRGYCVHAISCPCPKCRTFC